MTRNAGNYAHFGEYVAGFSAHDARLALTIRPFIKIERLTYGELQKRAYQAAHYLQAAGIRQGDRVMVVAPNSPEWLVLFLGVQLIGAILVPVDAGSSLATTLRFIKQTTPSLVFRGEHVHPELDGRGNAHVLAQLGKLIADFPNTAPKPQPKSRGENIALIVFTSGTTADPKGVCLTQQNILANISGIQQMVQIDADWRLLSVLPLSHMYELTGSLAVLSRGASIFYMPRVTPLAIAGALQDYHITTMLAIPQLLVLLLERIRQTAAERGKAKALAAASALAAHLPFGARRVLFRSVHARLGGHLRLVVTGGAPIPIETAIAWERMGVKMVQGYGLTETSPILTVNGLEKRRLDSPGRALGNVDLRISKSGDSNGKSSSSDNEGGEIQAKGPSIFAGYWQNPAATKAAFTKDGWFKTGDVGRLQNGWLHIQGRLKFAIVLSNGLKVFPEDIELAAAEQPDFAALCVVGVKDGSSEAVLAVVISDKPDEKITQAIVALNARLESFQHIASWRRWPDADFPRTRLLKIDRRKVQDWARATADEKLHDEAVEKPAADPLVQIVRLSLGEPHAAIKETSRLADIGLDSLRRLAVVALIEERLGVSIAESHVTQTTTIADLRALIGHGSPVESPQHRPAWPFWRWVRSLGNGLRESIVRGIVRIWVKARVEGQSNLDGLDSPALFIFNHADDFDGPVMYQALPRRIRKRLSIATAADVLRAHKALAFIIRFCFAGFDFARSEPYLPSLKYVGDMIDKGWNVAISPEGRVSPSGELQPFKAGIGLLSVDLGVPVVPIKTIGLHGTVPLHSKWPKKRSRMTVRIGQPVRFSAQTTYDEATKTLHNILESL